MFFRLKQVIAERILQWVREKYGLEIDRIGAEAPPRPELGDLALPVCFELARKLGRKPRELAGELQGALADLPAVGKVEIAGAGYLNVFFDRRRYLRLVVENLTRASASPVQGESGRARGKILVEHTNINPNKAAHVGHLRNAVLGDCLVRVLRFLGERVEVQNYIDDTGVQLADVIVGFLHMEKMALPEIRSITGKFDDYCWDLYARVSRFYEEDPRRFDLRTETLRAVEAGEGEAAEVGAYVAHRIVNCHLATMRRIGVRYDLLVWEGDVLKRRFWPRAFEKLKKTGAVFYATDGKNAGCWVMKLEESEGFAHLEEPDKILVRSNGTVTYVGKDIAYQMWKFGLLDEDFLYAAYEEGGQPGLYTTHAGKGAEGAPAFGRASVVYNVIDVRQAYLQNIVTEALRKMGYVEAADNSVHYAYEMVALTPACCRELGIELQEAEAKRSFVEMAGRKGIGVKADGLLDVLEGKAADEIRSRNPSFSDEDVARVARILSSAALRYFMVKYNRNKVVAFDFKEVLNFEGETGAYAQNAVVRAKSIFRKLASREGIDIERVKGSAAALAEMLQRAEGCGIRDDQWELILHLSRLSEFALQAAQSLELSVLAKYSFTLAQKFHSFYHKYRILGEADATEQWLRISIAYLFLEQLTTALDLLGIEVPERM
jgi:arginyl-tRNA synthetase